MQDSLTPEQPPSGPLYARESDATRESEAQDTRGPENAPEGPSGASSESEAPEASPAAALYAAVGQRIRTAREARGLNQAALGSMIGVGRSAISNIEAGRHHLAVHQLVATAQALRVDVDDLLTGPLPDLTVPPAQPAAIARPFWLQRDHDVTGVSGTGVVAHGVLWPDGTASVRWAGARPSIVFWDGGMADAEAVHGHGGATRIVFADQAQQDPGALSTRAAALCEAASVADAHDAPAVAADLRNLAAGDEAA